MPKERNRLFTNQCLRCGTTLIADQFGRLGHPYHCCTKCTDVIEKARAEVLRPGYKRKYSSPVDGQRVVVRGFHDVTHVVDAYEEED